MAKTQIYQQKDALSVYFHDMLAEPRKSPRNIAAKSPAPPEITPESTNKPSLQAESTAEKRQTEPKASESPLRLFLCQIAGIKVALPVSELNNIVHWPQQGLTQFPDQADWQLGLLSDRGQQIEVIDIGAALQATAGEQQVRPRYILLVDGRRLGIACEAIEEIASLETDAVHWREDNDPRSWFKGLLSESMHTLIDLPALLTSLDARDMA
ncbi:chemotaxis protein CheW [uncultured Methylophaga sp.]|uniref:chemotaxis protein CheW n=1 Tax=uncultured Methylophaga sp. TaxID=285271 RepID=UPI002620F548|nr:chemotaxis protein CheW [uncultured Methylophaga sp.]